MICPNQPLVCDAYTRFGSTGEPFRWYISQPPKWGPLMSHRARFPSDVRTNAPLRVPTRTRIPLIPPSFPSFAPAFAGSFFTTGAVSPPVEGTPATAGDVLGDVGSKV